MRPSDFVINQTENSRWLSFPPLNAFPFILHGFVVKNQNPRADERRGSVEKLVQTIVNRRAKHISLSQMHRDECVTITSESQLKRRYVGDAVLTDRNGVLISVAVADCLPIFLVSPKRKVIGMIHAGWRGTLLGIAPKTLKTARDRFGCKPEDFTVLLGPCIQSCCYRVSDDVAILFDAECVSRSHDGGRTLDLARANLKQFAGCGVEEDKIFVVGDCTHCEEQLYHSYRREKEDAGRMIGFLGLK
ncbi:MAG: peptidoglycan editing factor PgeF [Candidatus Zixiibacteriota bacterium]